MNNDRRALAAHTGESPGKRRAAVIAVLAMIFAMLTTINVIGSPQAAQAAVVRRRPERRKDLSRRVQR